MAATPVGNLLTGLVDVKSFPRPGQVPQDVTPTAVVAPAAAAAGNVTKGEYHTNGQKVGFIPTSSLDNNIMGISLPVTIQEAGRKLEMGMCEDRTALYFTKFRCVNWGDCDQRMEEDGSVFLAKGQIGTLLEHENVILELSHKQSMGFYGNTPYKLDLGREFWFIIDEGGNVGRVQHIRRMFKLRNEPLRYSKDGFTTRYSELLQVFRVLHKLYRFMVTFNDAMMNGKTLPTASAE